MNTLTSPCVGRCSLNTDNVCLGCFRSLTEITDWAQANTSTKQVILDNAELRRQKSENSTAN